MFEAAQATSGPTEALGEALAGQGVPQRVGEALASLSWLWITALVVAIIFIGVFLHRKHHS